MNFSVGDNSSSFFKVINPEQNSGSCCSVGGDESCCAPGSEEEKEASSPASWNQVYMGTGEEKLGWYEKKAGVLLRFYGMARPESPTHILDVGSGVSSFPLELASHSSVKITAMDLSGFALSLLEEKAGRSGVSLQTICGNVTDPAKFQGMDPVDYWNDRATFHFLRDPDQIESYKSNLIRVLKPGGYFSLHTFAREGATHCSGFPVERYDVDDLVKVFGSHFDPIHSESYTYTTPGGEVRPYTGVLFQRRF